MSPRQIFLFAEREQEEVEEIACSELGVESKSCADFQWRRPANEATNNVFEEGWTEWLRPRASANGFGDPHCQSFDGLSFEGNFHGEANWASCGKWSVQAVAEPVPGGTNATIITRFAVRYDYETSVARLFDTHVPESV